MGNEVGEIYGAMVQIMREVGAITKGRNNTQQGYKFRGIDDMYNALHDIMAKHGVFSVPKVLEIQRSERESKSGGLLTTTLLRVQYTFYAKDGSCVVAEPCGEGMDSGDKSCNKALAGAHKYALVQTFAIPTEGGDDSENENPEPVPITQWRKPIIDSIGKAVTALEMNEEARERVRGRIAKATTRKVLEEIRDELEGQVAILDANTQKAADAGFDEGGKS